MLILSRFVRAAFCFDDTLLTSKYHLQDIEPDNPLSILVDIVFRQCRFIDNAGPGVKMNLARLTHDQDAPMSIIFEDCDISWSQGYEFQSPVSVPRPTCFMGVSKTNCSTA